MTIVKAFLAILFQMRNHQPLPTVKNNQPTVFSCLLGYYFNWLPRP